MAQITEDYVSFEIAKLLKEKGFDEKCQCSYRKKLVNNKIVDEEELFISANLMLTNSELENKPYKHIVYCSTPTLQMAMKWLRKVHRLEIYPFHDMLQGSAWWYRIERNTGLSLIVEKEEDAIYETYEEACESAIKYCLENLI